MRRSTLSPLVTVTVSTENPGLPLMSTSLIFRWSVELSPHAAKATAPMPTATSERARCTGREASGPLARTLGARARPPSVATALLPLGTRPPAHSAEQPPLSDVRLLRVRLQKVALAVGQGLLRGVQQGTPPPTGAAHSPTPSPGIGDQVGRFPEDVFGFGHGPTLAPSPVACGTCPVAGPPRGLWSWRPPSRSEPAASSWARARGPTAHSSTRPTGIRAGR